jgi:hypothetical protein
MRRIGRSAFFCTFFVAAACGQAGDSRVAIATKLLAPRTLLDKADKLELRVLEGGDVGCDGTKGTLTNESAGKEIARQDLGDSGCASGVRFCGNLTIEKSDATRVFGATATNAGTTLAIGCASAKIDQDNVPLSIQMFRYLEPANCGDGIVQPTEQCEPPGGALCDDQCQSKELLLSTGSTGNKTDTGASGDKSDPFFTWSSGSGTAGRFLAFFTDKKTGTTNNTDVGLRAMSDSLAPLTTPPALASGSIFLSSGGSFPPDPAPFRQSMPQAAVLGGSTWVVFQDDNSPGAFGLDIHLRSLDDVLQAAAGDALVINGSGGEPGIQSGPSVAAGKSRLFVAWEDAGAGKISGRTLTAPSTLGSQIDISTGNANTQPSVAQTGDNFVIAWKSGTGIRFREVNDSGVPQGSDAAVSDGGAGFDRPRVASLSDGRFAVAWIADGRVKVQRFDAKGGKLPGDQAQPIDDGSDAAQSSGVAIAATPAAGGSYVVAWIDGTSGHARARFLGGTSGFLFNNVDGQATSFQASRVEGRTRANAAVGVGGSGPFVAIGWEDKGAAPNAGIVARRFPTPSE